MNEHQHRQAAIIERSEEVILPIYKRVPVVITGGEGVWVEDAAGNRYLDGLAGIAVNALGYRHPALVEAMQAAAEQVVHTSNMFYTEPAVELAERLLNETRWASKVFFCNSGTEAVEAALKFARRFGYNEAPGDHAGFIACDGSFHGRTFGALSVTSREAYRTPFTPLVPGIAFLPYNASDDEIEQIVDQQVGAVIIEPVQGEGGLHVATPEFLRAVRLRCNQIGALLIFDEIQSGLGRTGQIWAHEQLGVMPNMMTIAKPLGGGLPIGAVLLDDVAAEALSYGDHGSTFGANPFVCAVANKVVETITEPGFLLHVQSVGAELGTGLRSLQEKHSIIKEVRGRGLMWGIDCGATLVAPLVEAAFAAGLLVASAGPNVIRIVPPLIITAEEVQTLIQRLDQAFNQAAA